MDLGKLRESNQQQSASASSQNQHREKLQMTADLQATLFQSFHGLIKAVEGNGSKADAIALVVKNLDALEKQTTDNVATIETLKAGLATLEQQLKDVPTDSLKAIPKFLQARDTIKVTNLQNLEKGIQALCDKVDQLELTAEAPQITVEPTKVTLPAPIVHVDPPNLSPISTGLAEINKSVLATKLPDVVDTRQINTLVNVDFDEYRITYDSFDESEPTIESIGYYLKGKKVATLNYKYDSKGNIVGGKRAA